MPIVLGNDTITGLGVGGLPNGTINADDLASGAVTRAKMGYAGAVLQAGSSTQLTDQVINQSGSGENRGVDWYDTSALSVTITPTATSSKILIFGNVCLGTNTADNYNLHWRLVRNGTAIGNGTGQNWPAMGTVRSLNISGPYTCPFSFLDNPSSTSALTYKLQVLQSGRSNVIRINHNNNDGWQSGSSSTITVLEIAG
jgi:hypothetical protein